MKSIIDKRERSKKWTKKGFPAGNPLFKTAATYSPTRWGSTIGADGLNFSVRNGKRWNPGTIAT